MSGRSSTHDQRGDLVIARVRVAMCILWIVHVVVIASALADEGLLAAGVMVLGVLVVNTFATLVVLSTGRVRRLGMTVPSAAMLASIIDAIGLLLLARLTVAAAPEATLAWALMLWVPFSLGALRRPIASLIAGIVLAGAIFVASMVPVGDAGATPLAWVAVGMPVMIMVAAGLAVAAVAAVRDTAEATVHSELVDERHRASQLREIDELKNTFLAAVSHELRTPLTSILGFGLTMLDRPELSDQQRDQMLRTLVAEAEHLEEILVNLLDLDRLTRGKAVLVPERIDADVLVGEAVARASERTGRPVEVVPADSLEVCVDVAKVSRIVENLVNNAIKYTPEDAEVQVAVRSDSDGGIVIRVDDSGPGIPPELRARIFEPFRRGVDIGVAGTGVGLSIVERFSQMHGGRAWVEERPGGGCRFQVYLPSMTTEAGGMVGGGRHREVREVREVERSDATGAVEHAGGIA